MSDRHAGEPAYPRAKRSRTQGFGRLTARVAALGLSASGSVLMLVATLGAPATVSGRLQLVGEQTLLPLPIVGDCDSVTVPAVVTTVSVPSLPSLTTCASAHTSVLTSSSAHLGATSTPAGAGTSQPGTTSTAAGSPATTSRPDASSTTSSRASTPRAGALGADTGTPSTGTDIAFGIGIGLVIAGAGIGTGTGAFLKRRRTIE